MTLKMTRQGPRQQQESQTRLEMDPAQGKLRLNGQSFSLQPAPLHDPTGQQMMNLFWAVMQERVLPQLGGTAGVVVPMKLELTLPKSEEKLLLEVSP